MIKHAVAGRFAVVAAVMVSLSASAGVQTLNEGDSLADAVTAAKADYDANLTPQEIVLGKGTYELTAPQKIQFPLVVRGATGNPDDVTIDGKQKTQLFHLDHADAAILSVTLKNGRVFPEGDEYAPNHGGGVAIRKIDNQQAWRTPTDGDGGTVSNCVITGCSARMVNNASGAHAAAIACMSAKGLVTHCVIINNSSSRWAPSSTKGMIVSVMAGQMRNCLVEANRVTNDDGGCVISATGGCVVNCTVIKNSGAGASSAPINASGSAEVVNTVIAGNTTTSSTEQYACWKGSPSQFVNCVTDGSVAINETCAVSTLENMKFLDYEGGRLSSDRRIFPGRYWHGGCSIRLRFDRLLRQAAFS